MTKKPKGWWRCYNSTLFKIRVRYFRAQHKKAWRARRLTNGHQDKPVASPQLARRTPTINGTNVSACVVVYMCTVHLVR